MAARSPVPDLIFEDVKENRIRRILPLCCPRNGTGLALPALDRATMFVTHLCNFRCVYCNGPHVNTSLPADVRRDMLYREFTPDLFQRLACDWQKHGLNHVHFTGGEATLNHFLPDYLKKCRELGMVSSLTTNGSARPELYGELLGQGLAEIRISIDTPDPDEFDSLVGVKGAFQKVDLAIRELVRLRDHENFNVFIILNVCLQSFNLEKCKNTVRELLNYRPDDMKLLVVAECAGKIEEKASRPAVDELLKLAHSLHPANGEYELLQKKIHNLFRHNSFGLKDPEARHLMHRCYIPLTERTVDAKYVYPCSIYLRYRGEPLARVTADYAEQQAAASAFSENHDCRNDPICSANCTHCCREFNVETNRRLENLETERLARQYPAIEIPEISENDVQGVKDQFYYIKSLPLNENRPFFIIKPHGATHREEIINYLQSQGIVALERAEICAWADCALFLYLKERHLGHTEKMKLRMAVNRAFRVFEKQATLVLRIEREVPLKKIHRIKSDLRRWLGEEKRLMSYHGELVTLCSNVIHAPDSPELEWQNKVIKYFTKLKNMNEAAIWPGLKKSETH